MTSSNSSPKIVIAESSVVLRSGLAAVVRRIPNLNAYPVEVSVPDALQNYFQLHTPDIVIINPMFGGWFDLPAFKQAYSKASGTRYLATVSTLIGPQLLKDYDDSFSICDEVDTIANKINQLLDSEEEETATGNETEVLSQREREIITCVVKGMTNKAIADQLYLSIHTVITHRRNIARKLQIHSPAGLTIYAIANKLVELKDVKEIL